MKRKKYHYYFVKNEKACIVALVGGFDSVRHYRTSEQKSSFSDALWYEWTQTKANEKNLFRISKKQFLRFKETGKYPINENLE